MVVLISESQIGIHSETPQDCEVIPFVFIPTIKLKDGVFHLGINVKNERILELINSYNQGKEITFLLGYDLDENGELMAQALRNFFIKNNINSNDIHRTPLTEEGYIAVIDFLDINNLIKFNYYQREFLKVLKNNKIKSINFFELNSIIKLNAIYTSTLTENKSGGIVFEKLVERIDTNKTSTITFVTNNLIKGD